VIEDGNISFFTYPTDIAAVPMYRHDNTRTEYPAISCDLLKLLLGAPLSRSNSITSTADPNRLNTIISKPVRKTNFRPSFNNVKMDILIGYKLGNNTADLVYDS
jgi:hypothetical protein